MNPRNISWGPGRATWLPSACGHVVALISQGLSLLSCMSHHESLLGLDVQALHDKTCSRPAECCGTSKVFVKNSSAPRAFHVEIVQVQLQDGEENGWADQTILPGLRFNQAWHSWGGGGLLQKPSKTKHTRTWKQRSTGSASELARAIVASARTESERVSLMP